MRKRQLLARHVLHYSGDAIPEMVYVDFDLMREAPAHLVRGGIGDGLSCHTARWDWEHAVAAGHDPAWDEAGAEASLTIMRELRELARAIHDLTDDGLRGLMELHRLIGKLCDDLEHARFEEGSEHFFAYCFEFVNNRTIMHGELVSLGVLIMSAIQGNRPELVREIVTTARERHRPEDLCVGPGPDAQYPRPEGMDDGYLFFLRHGSIARADSIHFKDTAPLFTEQLDHPNYDDFWKARNLAPHLREMKPAMLTVGGWYDAEDLFGPLATYRAIEAQSPGRQPARHGALVPRPVEPRRR